MGRGQFGPAVHQLGHLFEGRSIAGASEWQLLRRYLDARDEVAFEAIVTRHGPMVLGVCRRVLADPRDVEDAFQATFLVLARKGGTLGEADPVGHWLHGVAFRVALRARSAAARRRHREGAVTPAESTPPDDPGRGDLAAVVDQELARLPAKYRAPVVLCYLEGQTHDEAARQLGWPLGTVKGRLSRARDLLRGRLARRGVAPAGLFALARGGRLAVPRALIDLAMRAATAGRASGMVPAAVSALAAGSFLTMMTHKLKAAAMIGLALVLGTGAAVMAYQSQSPPKVVATSPDRTATPAPRPATDDVEEWVAGWPELTSPPVDPKTRAILEALEKPIAMKFPNETPLLDVTKYVKQATEKSEGLPNGIPIYVDPIGLQDADKTMADTVTIDLEGVPLKHTLRRALGQLKLTYTVRDGMLTITSVAPEDEINPFTIMEEKARRGELTRLQYKQLIEALKLRKQVEDLCTTDDTQPKAAMPAGGFQ